MSKSKDDNEVVVTHQVEKAMDADGLVEAWFKEFFPNSPVSRDTEAWNLLLRAKDVLKQRLRGE
ncbi:MAG: hypothetical protein FJ121_08980 [Deltaproteobacteria bacterium]|nr:hypothetical protein [Deltaproteobacteria bacterium]